MPNMAKVYRNSFKASSKAVRKNRKELSGVN
jgi:hypothetical protein